MGKFFIMCDDVDFEDCAIDRIEYDVWFWDTYGYEVLDDYDEWFRDVNGYDVHDRDVF